MQVLWNTCNRCEFLIVWVQFSSEKHSYFLISRAEVTFLECLHSWLRLMSAEHFSWVYRWEITFFFLFFDCESRNCAEMQFASAADHTTVSLHSYPIKQIKLWGSGNHLINFYRVWWQGKVQHGVRIVFLVTQNGLDRDEIGSIALNSLGATRQGQKNAFSKGENGIINSHNSAHV